MHPTLLPILKIFLISCAMSGEMPFAFQSRLRDVARVQVLHPMNRATLMLGVLALMAGCDGEPTREQQDTRPHYDGTLLQCDGAVRRRDGASENVSPATRTYQFDDHRSKTARLWNAKRGAFEDLCSGNCSLISDEDTYSYYSTPKTPGYDRHIVQIKVDRVSGQLTDQTLTLIKSPSGKDRLVENWFVGDCKKVQEPAPIVRKF